MSDVRDLKVMGRSEDGTHIELADGDGASYQIRISDNLKALVNQPRLVSVAPLDGAITYSVKEIQARLRSGETAASISSTTNWSIEKIEKFSGPIMQERAYVIGVALQSALRRDNGAPTLAAATIAQLQPRGVDMTEVDWNTHRNDDGSWTIVLRYPLSSPSGGIGEALWNFDLDNRNITADDDGARWISGDERPGRPSTPSHGMVFGGEPTIPAPRLSSVTSVIDTPVAPTLAAVPDTTEEEFEEDIAPETISSDAQRDGVTKRIKVPTWDEIMFGVKKDDN